MNQPPLLCRRMKTWPLSSRSTILPLGAYTAVKEANREDRIKIIGFDGMPDGKQAIKEGKIYADPIQHPDKMGIQIVQLVVKYQAGEEFPKETLLPATLYTKAEADLIPT